MSAKKDLVLVLDASASMKELVRNDGTLMKKIEKLRLEIGKLLQGLTDGPRLLVFSFGGGIRKIYDGYDKAEAIAAIVLMDTNESNTAIWDSLERVLGEIKAVGISDALVACITDGEDNSSGMSRSEVTDAYKTHKGLTLKVLILNELIGDAEILDEDMQGEVVHIKDFSQIEEKLQIKDTRLVAYDELPINAAVLNLSEDGQQAAEAAGRAMKRIVPFLEKATGLRYYPVPTIIVDRKVAKQVGVSVKEVGEVVSVDPSEVLIELSKLVSGVAIAFHVRGLYLANDPENSLRESAARNYYEGFLPYMSEQQRFRFVGLAEAIGQYIAKYGEGDFAKAEGYYNGSFIELGKVRGLRSTSPFAFLMKCLRLISKTLRDMDLELQNQLVLTNGYFEMFDPSNRQSMRIIERTPNLDIWARYATAEQMTVLKNSLKEDGTWVKKASILSAVLDIAVDILERAYRDLARFKIKFIRIIDEIRTFGCYVPAGEQGKEWLEKIMFIAGCPEEVSIGNTGYVLLYKDVCMEHIGYTEDSPKVVDSEIWPALLDSVLCHEHFHAITEEGIDEVGKRSTSAATWTKVDSIVSEGTAEWSEIEFNRGNKEMTEITIKHASSGKLPGWPYRGAIVLEEKVQEVGVQLVSDVVKTFRAGMADKAYESFKKES